MTLNFVTLDEQTPAVLSKKNGSCGSGSIVNFQNKSDFHLPNRPKSTKLTRTLTIQASFSVLQAGFFTNEMPFPLGTTQKLTIQLTSHQWTIQAGGTEIDNYSDTNYFIIGHEMIKWHVPESWFRLLNHAPVADFLVVSILENPPKQALQQPSRSARFAPSGVPLMA